MGARTDFVRAMLFGVVIGVALTTAFFQLRTPGTPPAPALDRGASPRPPKITIEPAVESANKQRLVDALAKTGVAFDAAEVACDASCCRISVDDATYDEHADGIKSALASAPGRSWQATKAGTVRMLEKCW